MDRMRRVNELLQRELGTLFERMICSEVTSLVTITKVDTTPDLRNAHISVSIYGSDEQKRDAMRLIFSQRKEMQSLVSKNVKLKYTPRLEFKLDDTQESADRVLRLLDDIDIKELDTDEPD